MLKVALTGSPITATVLKQCFYLAVYWCWITFITRSLLTTCSTTGNHVDRIYDCIWHEKYAVSELPSGSFVMLARITLRDVFYIFKIDQIIEPDLIVTSSLVYTVSQKHESSVMDIHSLITSSSPSPLSVSSPPTSPTQHPANPL